MTPERRIVVALVACAGVAAGAACSADSDGAVPRAAADDPTSTASSSTDATTVSSIDETPEVTTTTTTTTTTTSTTTLPPLVEGVDAVEVSGPIGNAPEVPEFAWTGVDDADSYRLVVRGPDGPIWAWEGAETAIWLGGFTVEPPPGATTLAIVDETCWSVVAFTADDEILATTPLIPIAPDADATHTC